jgi:hypothetical protein
MGGKRSFLRAQDMPQSRQRVVLQLWNRAIERVVSGVGFASGSPLGMFSPIRLPPFLSTRKTAVALANLCHVGDGTRRRAELRGVAHPPYQISLLPGTQAMFDPPIHRCSTEAVRRPICQAK